MKLLNCAFALVLILPQALLAEQKLDLANSGFEDGESSWSISKNGVSVAVVPEAAHTGKLGLRITDKSDKEGAFVASVSLPSSAGKKYRLTFWGRNIEGATTAVYFLFFDAQQKLIGKVGNTGMSYFGEAKVYLEIIANPFDISRTDMP